MIPAPGTDRNKLVGTTAGLLVGGLAFFLTLFDYTLDLTRTALATGFFSGLLRPPGSAPARRSPRRPRRQPGHRGLRAQRPHVHVLPALAGDPAPARADDHPRVRRPPLAALDGAGLDRLRGRWWSSLSGCSCPCCSGLEEVSRTTAALVAVFVAVATGGTFLTFDAAQPWVYHEAYMWAVAGVFGGIYWLARLLMQPSRHAVWWLFVFALISVGTRATEGWSLCLVVVAVGLFMRYRPDKAARQDLWWRVLAGRRRTPPDLDRHQRVQVRLDLPLPAPGPGLDPGQPAPPRRARRQRRHDHRAPVLHHLVHGLPPARRHPVHRLLPVHHAARARRRRRTTGRSSTRATAPEAPPPSCRCCW